MNPALIRDFRKIILTTVRWTELLSLIKTSVRSLWFAAHFMMTHVPVKVWNKGALGHYSYSAKEMKCKNQKERDLMNL